MSKTNSFETAFLQLMFNNDGIANVGDVIGLLGAATTGSYWVGLWTEDPGEAATWPTYTGSEASYTSYARVQTNRNAATWSVGGNVCGNDVAITFPACTGGAATASHFAILTESGSEGTQDMLFYGSLTSTLAISNGITPEFASGSLTITED